MGGGPCRKGFATKIKIKIKKPPPQVSNLWLEIMCISDFFLHRRGEFILFLVLSIDNTGAFESA